MKTLPNRRWSRHGTLATALSFLLTAIATGSAQESTNITLALPAPPTPISTITNNATGNIDRFAWNTFIALNWPALHRSSTTTSNAVRGVPDTDASFALASPDSRTVWETFKEKREVFNIGTYNVTNKTFMPTQNRSLAEWHHAPNYGPYRPADQETYTPASGQQHPASQKLLIPGFKFPYNALDETIEVKAEGREPNMTTTNKVVAPRVWLHNTNGNVNTPVLYEVKVNKDFFDYVITNDLYIDEILRQKAKLPKSSAKGIRLPYRTSNSTLLGSGKNTSGITNYTATATATTYTNITKKIKSTPLAPLPTLPGIGSIHVKAAWIKLSDKSLSTLTTKERTDLAIDTYHVSDAAYYATDTTTEQPVAQEGVFALIGLHIIQRVHFGDHGLGGTFLFSTWEHESVTPGNAPPNTQYRYSNWLDPAQNGTGFGTQAKFVPAVADAYPIQRRPNAILPQTVKVNTEVHNAIRAALPTAQKDSHWLHYQLVGTQYMAYNTNLEYPPTKTKDVEFSTPPSKWETDNGQNNYLANLVIETNYGLQTFRGLPPLINKTNIVQRYQKAGLSGNPSSAAVFYRQGTNTVSGLTPVNMGGCMGCHGVAQIQGYNFSFVLLAGNDGAKTDTTTHFDLPPGKAPTD